jgi:hypothetical protein
VSTVVQNISLETVGLRVPNRNLRGFTLFNGDFKRCNCPVACDSAAHALSRDSGTVHCNGRSVYASRFVTFVMLIIGTN